MAEAADPRMTLNAASPPRLPWPGWATALPAAWLLRVKLSALLAGVLPVQDPYRQDLMEILQAPSAQHWLGPDSLGRDVFARVLHGLEVSLLVGFGAVGFGLAVGGPLGVLGGYYRGRLDGAISALVAIILSFPPLVLALAIIAATGASLAKVVLALGILFVPACARLVRASTLRFVDREFVLAARAAGAPDRQVILREIVPNLLPPLLAYVLLMVASAFIGEASLSFLGLSVPAPQPSLGGMVSAERSAMAMAPWTVFGPAGVLFLTILSLNVLGDQWQRRLDRRGAAL